MRCNCPTAAEAAEMQRRGKVVEQLLHTMWVPSEPWIDCYSTTQFDGEAQSTVCSYQDQKLGCFTPAYLAEVRVRRSLWKTDSDEAQMLTSHTPPPSPPSHELRPRKSTTPVLWLRQVIKPLTRLSRLWTQCGISRTYAEKDEDIPQPIAPSPPPSPPLSMSEERRLRLENESPAKKEKRRLRELLETPASLAERENKRAALAYQRLMQPQIGTYLKYEDETGWVKCTVVRHLRTKCEVRLEDDSLVRIQLPGRDHMGPRWEPLPNPTASGSRGESSTGSSTWVGPLPEITFDLSTFPSISPPPSPPAERPPSETPRGDPEAEGLGAGAATPITHCGPTAPHEGGSSTSVYGIAPSPQEGIFSSTPASGSGYVEFDSAAAAPASLQPPRVPTRPASHQRVVSPTPIVEEITQHESAQDESEGAEVIVTTHVPNATQGTEELTTQHLPPTSPPMWTRESELELQLVQARDQQMQASEAQVWREHELESQLAQARDRQVRMEETQERSQIHSAHLEAQLQSLTDQHHEMRRIRDAPTSESGRSTGNRALNTDSELPRATQHTMSMAPEWLGEAATALQQSRPVLTPNIMDAPLVSSRPASRVGRAGNRDPDASSSVSEMRVPNLRDRMSELLQLRTDWNNLLMDMSSVEPLWYETPRLLKQALRQARDVEDLRSTNLRWVEVFIISHYQMLKQLTAIELHDMPQHKALKCIHDRAMLYGDSRYLRPLPMQPEGGGSSDDSSSDTSEEEPRNGTSQRGSQSNASHPQNRGHQNTSQAGDVVRPTPNRNGGGSVMSEVQSMVDPRDYMSHAGSQIQAEQALEDASMYENNPDDAPPRKISEEDLNSSELEVHLRAVLACKLYDPCADTWRRRCLYSIELEEERQGNMAKRQSRQRELLLDKLKKMHLPPALSDIDHNKVADAWNDFRSTHVLELRQCLAAGCTWPEMLRGLLVRTDSTHHMGGHARLHSYHQMALKEARVNKHPLLAAEAHVFRLDHEFGMNTAYGRDDPDVKFRGYTKRDKTSGAVEVARTVVANFIEWKSANRNYKMSAQTIHESETDCRECAIKFYEVLLNDELDEQRGIQISHHLWDEWEKANLNVLYGQLLPKGRDIIYLAQTALVSKENQMTRNALEKRNKRLAAAERQSHLYDAEDKLRKDRHPTSSNHAAPSNRRPTPRISFVSTTQGEKSEEEPEARVNAVTTQYSSKARPYNYDKANSSVSDMKPRLPPMRGFRQCRQPAGSKGHPRKENWTEETWKVVKVHLARLDAFLEANPTCGKSFYQSEANSDKPRRLDHPYMQRLQDKSFHENACAYCITRPRAEGNEIDPEHPDNWKRGTGVGAHAFQACYPLKRYIAEGGEISWSDQTKSDLQSCLTLNPTENLKILTQMAK